MTHTGCLLATNDNESGKIGPGPKGCGATPSAVVDAHLGQGNVLLFGNNPVYRGETVGDYAMVFNAILNYQQLAHAPAECSK